VGDIPLDLQPKIAAALQEKAFERLGGTRTIPIDVRLVAANVRAEYLLGQAGGFQKGDPADLPLQLHRTAYGETVTPGLPGAFPLLFSDLQLRVKPRI
jgi:Sigma-54 interaction domain